jgi:hypothetical protein
MIGYTFVEIAQLIKINVIVISPKAIELLANTWQKFDVIN